jgi:hypothetical protein
LIQDLPEVVVLGKVEAYNKLEPHVEDDTDVLT